MPINQPTRMWDTPTTTIKPHCPACGGDVYETRGSLRCVRCHFVICESCGGGLAEDVAAEE